MGIVGDVGALGEQQLAPALQRRLHALAQGHRLLGDAHRRPAAEHVHRRVGQRADQGHGLRLLQRQGVAMVFQQHQGIARHRPRIGTVQAALGIDVGRVILGATDTAERVVEQAKVVLGGQDMADRLIQHALRHRAAAHQARQFLVVESVGHAHAHTGADRQTRRLAAIAGHAMAQQLGDRPVVAQRHALEPPVAAQQVAQQPAVGRSGNAVDGVERDHHPAGTGIDGRPVRRQVILVHAHRAHVDHVVVAPALHRAIQGEVLDAGHDALRIAGVAALIATHHGSGNARDQVGVLAEALRGTPPAGITGDIDGRCEGHVEAVGTGFERRDPGAVLDGRDVPARRQTQADGKGGAMAVDDVVGEEHRNAQAAAQRRLLHGPVLRAHHRVEGGADAPGRHLLADALARHVAADADQAQLTDLLFQGHAADQVGDEGGFVIDGGGGSQQAGGDQQGSEGERAQVSHREGHPGCESLFECSPRYSDSPCAAVAARKKPRPLLHASSQAVAIRDAPPPLARTCAFFSRRLALPDGRCSMAASGRS